MQHDVVMSHLAHDVADDVGETAHHTTQESKPAQDVVAATFSIDDLSFYSQRK